MPRGANLTDEHQRAAAMRPRPGQPGKTVRAAQLIRLSNETLDEAILRLQIAKADTEELDKAKRQLDLDVAQGRLITIEEAVDTAQAAVLRVCQILDLIPERLRDRLQPAERHICEILDEIIHSARAEVADGPGRPN